MLALAVGALGLRPNPDRDPVPSKLAAQADIAQRADGEQARRLAEQALAALVARPDADLEARARLVLCSYYAERDVAATEAQIAAMQALLTDNIGRVEENLLKRAGFLLPRSPSFSTARSAEVHR